MKITASPFKQGGLLVLALSSLMAAEGDLRAGVPGTVTADQAATVRFEDVTARSGVSFLHQTGASGEKYMQETMGSGIGLLDVDGDGDLDLYLVNGAPLPLAGGRPAPADPAARNALYLNDGHGVFTDVSVPSGAADRGYGMGVAVGDYDNDGDPDLYILNHGPNVLYRNKGDGTFEDVTTDAGVGDAAWSSSAVFFDADADGDLDLFVVNYCTGSVDNNKWCGHAGAKFRAYCTPKVYDAVPDTFYLNEGNGHFVDATSKSGLLDRDGKGLGVVALDYDDDGDEDLHVANDSTPNQLWRNDGHGHFKEVGLLAGIAYSEDGRSEAGMGTDAGDFDGDGRQDLVVTNLDYETNSLLLNRGRAFVHYSYPAGLAAASLGLVGFGINAFDIENDGDLDLVVINGHIIDNITLYNDTLFYKQPNQVFINRGDGRFVLAGETSGLARPNVGRGSAVGDLNGDGRLDLVISRNGEPAGVFMNRSPAGHWLRVKTVGTVSNRAGYGARVILTCKGKRQIREVRATTSYQSSSDPVAHFGLGSATQVESLEVRWPSGRRERFRVKGVDRVILVKEGTGTLQGSTTAGEKMPFAGGGRRRAGHRPVQGVGTDQWSVHCFPPSGSDETESDILKERTDEDYR